MYKTITLALRSLCKNIWPQNAVTGQLESSISESKIRPILGRHASHYVHRTKAQLQSFMMTKYFLYKVLIRFGHKLCAWSSMKVFVLQFYSFLPSKVLERKHSSHI